MEEVNAVVVVICGITSDGAVAGIVKVNAVMAIIVCGIARDIVIVAVVHIDAIVVARYIVIRDIAVICTKRVSA